MPDPSLPSKIFRGEMRRFVKARAIVFLLMFVSDLYLGAVSSFAAETVATGWWWRLQGTGGISLPRPPTVPEGGLLVGSSPEGATAISALRFRMDEELPAELSLKVFVESGRDAAISACPVGGEWGPVEAGRWDARPQDNCAAGYVQGIKSPEENIWTFLLTGFGSYIEEGQLDLLLVPTGYPAVSSGTPTFEVSFDRPAPDVLLSAPKPPPPPPETQVEEPEEIIFDEIIAAPVFAPAPLVPAAPQAPVEIQEPRVEGVAQPEAFSRQPVPASSKVVLIAVISLAVLHSMFAMTRRRASA